MKKKMIALIAGALMALSTSSAFAAFADLDLIRVVYQRSGGTQEIATELGNVETLIGTAPNGVSTVISAPKFTDAMLNDPSNYYVAYFAKKGPATDLWFTGTADTKIGTSKSSLVNGNFTGIYSYYNQLGGTAGATQVDGSTTNPNSYKVKSAGAGQFGGVFTIANLTEVNLAELAKGPIVQDIYYFNNYATSQYGVKVASIATYADGTTTVNPTVPVPAAAYLLGSGLLGLVGIRRKMNK